MVFWQVRWSVEGKHADLVTLWDEQNQPAGQSLVINLPSLAPTPGSPGEIHPADLITLQYHWDAHTPPLTVVQLKAVFALQPPLNTPDHLTQSVRSSHDNQLVDIQQRQVELTCVPAFALPDGYEDAWCVGLLVFSPGAPSEVSNFWYNLLTEQMQMPTCIWNLERYGHFEPDHDAQLAVLSATARNMLVVVMDFPYHPQGDRTLPRVMPSGVISQQALIEHFPHSTSRFLVVSNFGGKDLHAAKSVASSTLSAFMKEDTINCTTDLLQAVSVPPELELADSDDLRDALLAAIQAERLVEDKMNESESITVHVSLPSGPERQATMKLRAPVALLKNRIGLGLEQGLVFAGELLTDSSTLEDAGISDGALLEAIDLDANTAGSSAAGGSGLPGRARRHVVMVSKCSQCCRPKQHEREELMQAELMRLKELLLTVKSVRFNLVHTTTDGDVSWRDVGSTFHVGDIDIHWEAMDPDDISARPTEAVRISADEALYATFKTSAPTYMHFGAGAALPGGPAAYQFKQRYNKLVNDGAARGLDGRSITAGLGAALLHNIQREIESTLWDNQIPFEHATPTLHALMESIQQDEFADLACFNKDKSYGAGEYLWAHHLDESRVELRGDEEVLRIIAGGASIRPDAEGSDMPPEPAGVNSEMEMSCRLDQEVLVDSPAGFLLHDMKQPLPSGEASLIGTNRIAFRMSMEHQKILLGWTCLQWTGHILLLLFTVGLWGIWMCCVSLRNSGKCFKVLVYVQHEGEDAPDPAYMEAITVSRELICGLRMLREHGCDNGVSDKHRDLTIELLEKTEEALMARLLPEGLWFPSSDNTSVDEFLNRRLSGLKAQMSLINSCDIESGREMKVSFLYSFDGWRTLRHPEQGADHLMHENARTSVQTTTLSRVSIYTHERWTELRESERERQSLRGHLQQATAEACA
eukprot:TRINITY_DN995_c0_g2_i5.p1 TRINITY_DN995_c0_g2~~TRINITY_DN995_c0_g2_i5.p1  ORF type:complete len:929 (+),score=216.10 TRINITY_DN995_c0_g2_i5:1842-4628(+)